MTLKHHNKLTRKSFFDNIYSQELKLVPLSPEEKTQTLEWDESMFNGTLSQLLPATGLLLNHNYEPKIRVFFTISEKIMGYTGNTSVHSVECKGTKIYLQEWQCLMNKKFIPWNAICNGTDSEGKTDCEDGSDESDLVCHGEWAIKVQVIVTFVGYVILSIIAYVIGNYYYF